MLEDLKTDYPDIYDTIDKTTLVYYVKKSPWNPSILTVFYKTK